MRKEEVKIEDKSPIHHCRKEYNDLIDKISEINPELYEDYIKQEIIYFQLNYTKMSIANGRVCFVCGLTPLEKVFLIKEYNHVIAKLKKLIILINTTNQL